MYNNKSILISGGTGSFGSSMIKYILSNFKPKRLICFSRDELKQYNLSKELNEKKNSCLRFFIGDVRDYDRLNLAMKNVDYVIHAAALKHVPAAEYNPFECIKTNIHGTENIVRAAIENKVKKIITLSTDKACNPINLYGASKLAADKITISANNYIGNSKTKMSVVRYGNVMGSRGSVIPVFMSAKDQNELPITISSTFALDTQHFALVLVRYDCRNELGTPDRLRCVTINHSFIFDSSRDYLPDFFL